MRNIYKPATPLFLFDLTKIFLLLLFCPLKAGRVKIQQLTH